MAQAEARGGCLILGELRIASGNVEAGIQELEELARVARDKGYALVARKATKAVAGIRAPSD